MRESRTSEFYAHTHRGRTRDGCPGVQHSAMPFRTPNHGDLQNHLPLLVLVMGRTQNEVTFNLPSRVLT